MKLTEELKNLDGELNELACAKKGLSLEYENSYKTAQEQSREEFKQRMLTPLQERLANVQQEYDSLKQEYESSKSELTEENLLEQYSSQQDILSEVRESTIAVQKQLKETIGSQFYNVLYQHLEDRTIQLEESDLDSVISYFNQCSAKLDKVLKSRSPITKFVNGFEDKVMGSELSISSNNMYAVIAVVYLVISFFLYKFIFPVYGMLLVFQAGYNIVHFYNIYKILVVQKSVQDNISLIDQKIHEEVLNDLAQRIEENDNYYQKEFRRCENSIDKINTEIMSVSVSVSNAFHFDDSDIKREYDRSIQAKNEHESNLMESKYSKSKELQKLQEEVSAYKEQLTKLLQEAVDFSSIGKDKIFDPNFTIDVDEKEMRLQTFVHPNTSSLFLYNTVDEVYEFIRLINIQLRHKLDPLAFTVKLYDSTTIGAPCLKFTSPSKKKGDTSINAFKIFTEQDALRDALADGVEILESRMNSIRREFKCINDYNAKMLELDSVPETYEFWFIVDPESSFIESPSFQKLLINGGDLGIYCHVFKSETEFNAGGDTSKSLLDSVNVIYLLQNGVLNKVAKEKVREPLDKRK